MNEWGKQREKNKRTFDQYMAIFKENNTQIPVSIIDYWNSGESGDDKESKKDDTQEIKLMRSNRPLAKFRLKSYSNNILINFFDPKFESKLSRRNQFQQLNWQVWNQSILIKNGRKRLYFD